MTEAIVFPFAEKLLRGALLEHFNVPITTRVPKTLPPTFIRLTRVGGGRRDPITDQPMIVVEVWGSDELEVGELALEVQARVYALAQTQTVHGWVRAVREIGGLQSFPDPVSERPRYQFTAQLDLRGTTL